MSNFVKLLVFVMLINGLFGCASKEKNNSVLEKGGVLTAIDISSNPDKIIYSEGEELDLAGLVIIGIYSDGTKKVIPFTLENITGFDSKTYGTKTVTVTIDKKSVTFYVAVQQKMVQFNNIPAIEDCVIYEVNLRAFSPAGNLKGVIDRLDIIKSLGVNVIWLMPIYSVGDIKSINSPYCVKDYRAVGAEYGTMEDLKTLVNTAHSKGMAVILDWVANHTSWDNEWIRNKDWYIQDNSGNIISPSVGGTQWSDVAQLNYNNSDMKRAMLENMKYWVTNVNIDGFRCDYADGVPVEFWETAINTIKNIPDRKFIFLAEGGKKEELTAGFDMLYNWNFYSKLLDVFQKGASSESLYDVLTNDFNNIPQGKSLMKYTTNHDETSWNNTPIVLFNGVNGALAASVINIFTGGVPLFYTGQEVGRRDKINIFKKELVDWSQNQEMLNSYQKIMKIYSENKALRAGINTYYRDESHNIICFSKKFQNDEFLIIVNTRNKANTFVVPTEIANSEYRDLISESKVILKENMVIGAYEYLILKK